MVAVARILFATLLGVSAATAAQITGPCPSGQQLISNNKCCPGYSIVDKDDTVCCVTDTDNSCAGIGLCGNGSVGGSCKAKVSINDPDYDQKVKNAQSGTADSQSSSSSSSASASPTASSAPSSTGSDSAATGSSTDSASSTSSSPAKSAATTTNNAMLGMVVGLAAVLAIFYGL